MPPRSVIYLDSSVVLARILVEDRRPRPSLWQESLSQAGCLNTKCGSGSMRETYIDPMPTWRVP